MVALQRVSRLVRDPKATAEAVARRLRTPPCLVCGSRRSRTQVVDRKRRSYEIRICQRCLYVSNFTNTVDYTAFESVDSFRLSPRVGTEEHQGREFHMAEMGAEILGRQGLTVMVFGAGRSLDYRHIAKLPAVERVVMSDVVDLGIDADFINIANGTSERFDLIIACEVVEHFTDPRTEFPRLFKLLTKNGLLVCSTNIYDGRNVKNHRYLYSRGHTSYYSPKAIGVIARRSRMRHDFRVPEIATGSAGPRKRYVLFTRSRANSRRIVEYFGRHAYAPSEDVGDAD
ncbi:methyltransferase domain-containing protein [Aeromicrobium sp. NPDC092404]|uniref:methyltransferase domain-containing protein n=1 Tax=Aeromicrobium sp. NPDC092404 TaxID=3154976 RepID=UPI00342C6672